MLPADGASIWDAPAGNKQNNFWARCLPMRQCCFVHLIHPCAWLQIRQRGANRGEKTFYWWLKFLPSALVLCSCFSPTKTHFLCLSLSLSAYPPPLSALWCKRRKTLTDSAHIAKLLTGHSVCQQGRMHTCYQRLLSKTSPEESLFSQTPDQKPQCRNLQQLH